MKHIKTLDDISETLEDFALRLSDANMVFQKDCDSFRDAVPRIQKIIRNEKIDRTEHHVFTSDEIKSVIRGRGFCFSQRTISFNGLELPIGYAQWFVSSNGGFNHTNVTKTTHYLVCDDPTVGTTKTRMAKKYGIPIITGNQFFEMVKTSQTHEKVKKSVSKSLQS